MIRPIFTARDTRQALAALRILGVVGPYQQPDPSVLRDAEWLVMKSLRFDDAIRAIGERHGIKHIWWRSALSSAVGAFERSL
jgi:hypothetical protein